MGRSGRPADDERRATWLNSHDDPRNTRQNYQRATGSWRMKKRWESTSAYRYTLGGSLDYTGSFDRQKSDRDIDEGPAGIPSNATNRVTTTSSRR